MPTVSIIIATWNAAGTLERCLTSCVEQDYPFKELIIIDGGSTDGTTAVIQDFASHIKFWVSEPDNGIYHAWNKALKFASAEWICFLGADDCWTHADSLANLMSVAHYPEVNFVSAMAKKCSVDGSSVKSFGKPFHLGDMKKFMTIAHTGALHHYSLFKEHGIFDESYRIAGDFEFLLRAGRDIRGAYVAEEAVLMGGAGISSTQCRTVYKEGRRALKSSPEGGLFWAWWFFCNAWIKHFFRKLTHS